MSGCLALGPGVAGVTARSGVTAGGAMDLLWHWMVVMVAQL